VRVRVVSRYDGGTNEDVKLKVGDNSNVSINNGECKVETEGKGG